MLSQRAIFSAGNRAGPTFLAGIGRFSLSSIADQASTGAPAAEFVEVHGLSESLAFYSSPQYRWGAQLSLNGTLFAGSAMKERVAVVRDAFAPFDQNPKSLHSVMASMGSRKLAISSMLSYPETRLLVDEYCKTPQGDYILETSSMDILRYIKAKGIMVDYVPDPVSAVGGAYNGSRVRDGALQSSNEVLMVAPTAFTFNQEAAQDNYFMNSVDETSGSRVTALVCKEYAALYHELTEVAGVKVQLFAHGIEHGTPDACFPNNWFSTHPVGEALGGVQERTLVLYPMKCPNRAAERRKDMRQILASKGYTKVVDLTQEENSANPAYFEGTGVLVNDRINGVAYVALSERAHPRLAQKWVEEMGYRDLVTFHATDATGHPIYHTNVMMAIGTDVAIVCSESVEDEREREHLLASLRKTHTVVEISRAQMGALAGNALEVQDGRGLPAMAMSSQAYHAFTPEQRGTILQHCASIIHAPIDTLERIGGGGVRCTLGEIF